MLRYELTRWLGYLWIQHPQMSTYTRMLPLGIGAILAVAASCLPVPLIILGPSGLFAGVLQVFSILPGFFIAALAAVATFNKPDMDETMPPPAPTIEMRFGSESDSVELTRRVFLSYLFSYLTVASLLISVSLVLGIQLTGNVGVAAKYISSFDYGFAAIAAARFFILYSVFTACASVLVVTLQGIYFLTEGVHRPNE